MSECSSSGVGDLGHQFGVAVCVPGGGEGGDGEIGGLSVSRTHGQVNADTYTLTFRGPAGESQPRELPLKFCDRLLAQLGARTRTHGAGLVRSLDEYDVGEDDGSDPVVNAMRAQDLMNQAAEHAGQIGRLLQEAQNTIDG